MADHGFRVKNATTGSKQIDQDYFNLALISKQSVTSASTPAPGTGGSATVSVASVTVNSSIMPRVAFASTHLVAPNSVERSGNTWTFYYYVAGLSRPITFYIFGSPPALSPGFGTRLTKGGMVRFDSRHRYLRRVARSSASSGSLPGGATYAATLSNAGLIMDKQVQVISPSFYRVTEIVSKGGVMIDGANWSSSMLSLRSALYESSTNPGPSYSYSSPVGPVSILDVTNY